MIYRIIATSLALIPFFCWFGWDDGIRTPKEVASIIALLAIVGVSLYSHTLKSFKNKWLLLLGGWCFFTTVIGITTPIYLDKIILNLPPNLIAYKSLFYICLSIMAIICLSSIPIDLKKISKVINWVAILLCLYGIIQIFGCDEFFRVADSATGWIGKNNFDGSFTHRIVGTLGNPSILAIFLAICLPFSLCNIKNEGKFSIVLSSVLIGLTQSATAIVCAIVIFILALLFINRKLGVILIVLSILGGVMIYEKLPFMINPTGRFEVLKEGWKILEKKPLTGLGLGSWEHLVGGNPDVVKRLHNQNWKEAHNEPYEIWFEIGLIGLSLILLALWSSFVRFFKNITWETYTLALSVVAICIAGLTYFPFRVGPLAFYSVLIYGMFENKIGERI